MKPVWTVRVRTASTGPAKASARSHSFEIGDPLNFGGADILPSALETALGALCAELVNGFRDLARKRRVPIDGLEIVCNATLDSPLVALGVIGEEGLPAIQRIDGAIHVTADAEPAVINALWAETLTRSALYNTLAKSAELCIQLRIHA